MKPPKFHVGEKVVCITSALSKKYSNAPTLGCIYTVRQAEESRSRDPRNGAYCYFLNELEGQWSVCEAALAPIEEATDEALAKLLEESFSPVTT